MSDLSTSSRPRPAWGGRIAALLLALSFAMGGAALAVPTRALADIVLPRGSRTETAVALIAAYAREKLRETE